MADGHSVWGDGTHRSRRAVTASDLHTVKKD